jgi:CBS domain containing-hemolysin-like protein
LVAWLARKIVKSNADAAADVAEVLRERADRGELMELSHHDMVMKAVRFDRLKVNDVMRPRAEIVGIEISASLGEAARVFSQSQHSRLPVYRENLDDPLGFVHVRDVMALLAPDENEEVSANFADRLLLRVKRDILFVPPSMRLSALFLRMQSSRIHLALVVDEYGGTDGLVSMEDLVEQIVGEIDDEHDEEATLIQERVGGGFDADGRASIEKLEAALGVPLALPDHEDEFDTAAGLAVAMAGHLPQRGEILRHPAGFEIEIIDADPRRVKRLRFKRAAETQPESAAQPAPAASENAKARRA